MRWLYAIVLILAVAAGGAWVWMQHELQTPYYGASEPEVFVEIPRGAGSNRIARLLEERGILRERIPFELHLLRLGAARSLKAGEYRFARPATPVEIAERLMRGDVHFVSVTVREGLTAEETVLEIERAGVATAAALRAELRRTDGIRDLDPLAPNLEGYLFPETYRFSRAATPAQVLQAMTARFREVFGRIARETPPREGWSTRAIVTLASMVEKEVGNAAERPRVASVLANRLATGMPLGCDPTVVYALKLAGRYDGNIRKADLSIESPYNTYVHAGLPPGPIANPGESSLRAALRPEETEYLYFVSRNDGTHVFAKEYAEHVRNVNKYQRAR